MKVNILNSKPSHSFNMTPIIDIVFLLIIFFMLVCRYIEAENFPVAVPDSCSFASNNPQRQAGLTTVTVMTSDDGQISFAVGAKKIPLSTSSAVVEKLAGEINNRLSQLPLQRRVVILRIDENICFADAQYALAALAESDAVNIQLAVLKDKRNNLQ